MAEPWREHEASVALRILGGLPIGWDVEARNLYHETGEQPDLWIIDPHGTKRCAIDVKESPSGGFHRVHGGVVRIKRSHGVSLLRAATSARALAWFICGPLSDLRSVNARQKWHVGKWDKAQPDQDVDYLHIPVASFQKLKKRAIDADLTIERLLNYNSSHATQEIGTGQGE